MRLTSWLTMLIAAASPAFADEAAAVAEALREDDRMARGFLPFGAEIDRIEAVGDVVRIEAVLLDTTGGDAMTDEDRASALQSPSRYPCLLSPVLEAAERAPVEVAFFGSDGQMIGERDVREECRFEIEQRAERADRDALREAARAVADVVSFGSWPTDSDGVEWRMAHGNETSASVTVAVTDPFPGAGDPSAAGRRATLDAVLAFLCSNPEVAVPVGDGVTLSLSVVDAAENRRIAGGEASNCSGFDEVDLE